MVLKVAAVAWDCSNTLMTGDPDYPAIDDLWAASGFPGLERAALNIALSTDTFNGRIHRHLHELTPASYLDFASGIRLEALQGALVSLGHDPAGAERALDVYHAWLFGDGDRLAGWSFTQIAFPDAVQSTAELRGKGVPQGVGTNWDWDAVGTVWKARHQSALHGADAPTAFGSDVFPAAHIRTSAQLGVRKPAIDFYRQVFKALRVAPEDAVWVGDDVKNDVEGPLLAGAKNAVLISRDGTVPAGLPRKTIVVTDLTEFSAMVVPCHGSARQPAPVTALTAAERNVLDRPRATPSRNRPTQRITVRP